MMRSWEAFWIGVGFALFFLMKGALWMVGGLERVAGAVAAVFTPLVLSVIVVVAVAEGVIAVAVAVGMAASLATRIGVVCSACAVVALAGVGGVSILRRART
jgi:hypothetical protein